MKMKFIIPTLLAITPLSGQCAEQTAEFPIPQALAAEHKALHEMLGVSP